MITSENGIISTPISKLKYNSLIKVKTFISRYLEFCMKMKGKTRKSTSAIIGMRNMDIHDLLTTGKE